MLLSSSNFSNFNLQVPADINLHFAELHAKLKREHTPAAPTALDESLSDDISDLDKTIEAIIGTDKVKKN